MHETQPEASSLARSDTEGKVLSWVGAQGEDQNSEVNKPIIKLAFLRGETARCDLKGLGWGSHCADKSRRGSSPSSSYGSACALQVSCSTAGLAGPPPAAVCTTFTSKSTVPAPGCEQEPEKHSAPSNTLQMKLTNANLQGSLNTEFSLWARKLPHKPH